ncbi:MAG: cytochrome ubiquinol oxidase subunit I [Thermoanaerobaculia bacterium]
MDVVWLSRVQFALTVMFHFIFPPITIGLSLLIAFIETARWRTGKDLYRRMSDFWIRIFAVNFVVGVATGIVMEFEFGTNWAGYSRFVGDIFGAPLAAEGVFAFFLESGFLGLLILGRKRISSFVRWFASVMVCAGATLSAFWIIVANSWMQTPAGFRLANGRAELIDFQAAVFNPSTLPRYFHTIASTWVASAFLMIAISAWYFLRNRPSDVARASLKLGVIFALVGVVGVFFTGDRHAKQVAHTQEAKFAAMEGLYSTTEGAPLVLFSLPPGQDGRPEGPELLVTRLTSFLAFGNFRAPVKGLNEFPREQWPPVALTFLSFHNMVILGNLMLLEIFAGLVLLWRGRIERSRRWLWVMVFSVVVPHIAIQLGWMAAEAGRQPWIVYGVMKTVDAASRVVTAPEVLFSIVMFSVIYALLFALWVRLIWKEIAHGPEGVEEPITAGGLTPQEA